MQIDFYYRTFGELKVNKDLGFDDPEGIMASLNNRMREALLCNPSGYTDDETCQILALYEKRVVGCINAFMTRVSINNKVHLVQTGSYLYASEKYRKENVGGELFFRLTNLHPQKKNYYAGISQMAQPIYKVLKYKLFEFPRLIYLRKSKSIVHALLKTESNWCLPVILMADCLLWVHRIIIVLLNSPRHLKYQVVQSALVSKDIERISLNDHHPFMEVHDKAWLQWNLNHTFSTDNRNKKRLYEIKKGNATEAFFIIKQEFFEQASSRGFKNVYLGSVVEWGIDASSKLQERDLYLMALSCFDKCVDGVQVATSDMNTVRSLKRNMFVRIGDATMAFKMKSVKDEGMDDINNWRVRIAGGDTLLD